MSAKQGKYSSVEDAIQQKQADLLSVLAGVDLTRLMGTDENNSNPDSDQAQPTGDNNL